MHAGERDMNGQMATVLRYIRQVCGATECGNRADSELLQTFIAARDESAFAGLLQRHGPLVFGVCRQVMGDQQEAEDAFQATFLVLAQKAASIRRHESLAGWLYRVALNISREAKRLAAKKRSSEKHAIAMSHASEKSHPGPDHEAALRDWQPLIHEEVDRLPNKYRLPVVHCYLEGRTHQETARLLGWPLGTVKGRLARARALLETRLVRRGLALSSGALAGTLTQSLAQAELPTVLFGNTVKGAVSFARGTIPAATVSAEALALAKGALNALVFTKLAHVAAVIMVIGVLAVGTVLGLSVGHGNGDPLPAVSNQPDAKPERLDAQGDPLPPGAIARLGTLRFRNGKVIHAIGWGPDGKTVVSAGSGAHIVVHDARAGKNIQSFGCDTNDVSVPDIVAFAPDGKSLAALVGTRAKRFVSVWGLATGKQVVQFDVGKGAIGRLALSHDGRTLVGTDGGEVHVWDVRAGKEIRRFTTDRRSMTTFALAPDGKILVTAAVDRPAAVLSVWDTVSGRKLHEWQAHQGEVYALAFSPDGKRLASASIEGENRLRVWTVPPDEPRVEIAGEFHSLHFSPCGKVLAGTSNTSVFLWEADSGKEIRRIPKGRFGLVAFSPEGSAVAVSDGYAISLWDRATGKRLDPPLDGHDDYIGGVGFLSDGKTLVSTSMQELYFWQVDTRKLIRRFEGPRVDHGILSPDGKVLALSPPDENQTIELWDTETGKKLRELAAEKYSSYALAFSPDGKTLAAARTGYKAIQFWDVASAKSRGQFAIDTPEPASERSVHSLVFSPDGKTLAVGDGGLLQPAKTPQVHLLEAASGRERQRPFDMARALNEKGERLPIHYISSVTFVADGKLLIASGNDGMVQVWDVATGKVVSGQERIRNVMAISPDGKTVALAGADGSVRLRDLATGKDRRHLLGHLGPVMSLAWSPDGKTLASGSQDTTILLWAVEPQ
jgi:RNA polymerase sigma factor (sigma-70 family)